MIRNRKPRKIVSPARTVVESRVQKSHPIKGGNFTKALIVTTKINVKKEPKVNINHTQLNYSTVDPIFKGETVYIIGGGPSLKDFDWNKLLGKKVIAINKAFYHHQHSQVMYWTDSRFYTWYKDDIDKFKGLKYTLRKGYYNNDVRLLKRGVKYGIELSKDTLAHGNNSGYAAINLAYHLGAKKIVLLGYDMGNVGGKSHFHEGYPSRPVSDEIYQKQFMPGFGAIYEALKGKGIQVYNACPTSNLKVFPIITIDKALSFS